VCVCVCVGGGSPAGRLAVMRLYLCVCFCSSCARMNCGLSIRSCLHARCRCLSTGAGGDDCLFKGWDTRAASQQLFSNKRYDMSALE